MLSMLRNIWVVVFTISSAIFGVGITWQKFIDRVSAAESNSDHALKAQTELRHEVRDEFKEISAEMKQIRTNQDEMFRFMIRWKREEKSE